MKKIYLIAGLIFFLGYLAKPVKAIAQNEQDLAAFLEAGAADASKMTEAYLKPVVTSMSYGMTAGWFTTAKAHSTLGFDLSISMNLAFIPTADNYFNPNNLGLSTNYVGFSNSTTGTQHAPTIVGPKDDTQYIFSGDLDGNAATANQTVTITGPEGFDLKEEIGFASAPVPMIQAGIGIIKNTDLKIRFVPTQEFGESEFNMFGIGVMHDIKQHIKGIKLLPFDLSALVAYNSVTGSTDLKNANASQGPISDDGVMDYKFNSWIFQALISKKISVLTGYAGIGYSIVDTNVDVKGEYNVVPSIGTAFTLTNPVAIDYKNNSMRMTLGMRLKLGPIFFNGDYTFQKYNTLSVGFGLAIR